MAGNTDGVFVFFDVRGPRQLRVFKVPSDRTQARKYLSPDPGPVRLAPAHNLKTLCGERLVQGGWDWAADTTAETSLLFVSGSPWHTLNASPVQLIS